MRPFRIQPMVIVRWHMIKGRCLDMSSKHRQEQRQKPVGRFRQRLLSSLRVPQKRFRGCLATPWRQTAPSWHGLHLSHPAAVAALDATICHRNHHFSAQGRGKSANALRKASRQKGHARCPSHLLPGLPLRQHRRKSAVQVFRGVRQPLTLQPDKRSTRRSSSEKDPRTALSLLSARWCAAIATFSGKPMYAIGSSGGLL